MRILIVDDHEIVRRGVRQILAAENWEICGEAQNGRVAVEKVRALEPDVVVLDVSMPVMNGHEAASAIKRISPSTKIVFLTMHDARAMAAIMKTTGVDACVTKSETAERLVSVLKHLFPVNHGTHLKMKSESRRL